MAEATASWPSWSPAGARGVEEIEAILDYRARRAIRHFEGRAHGGTERACPVCGYHGRFAPVRHKPEIWCPQCDSRPRHRLMKLWMDREMRLARGARVTHFAAEPWVRAEMAARGVVYETADIHGSVDRLLDITDIDLVASSREMIIANHVLEHVDDRAALAEIHRVLAPGGTAVITVPVVEGWDETLEGAGLDRETRRSHLGDPDHLRFYGRDIRARFRAAAFAVAEFPATEPDVTTHALHRGERLFLLTRQAHAAGSARQAKE